MSSDRGSWRTTTHDWSHLVDGRHIEAIRGDPARFAPGGPAHLVLEVLAYAIDEAADGPAYGADPRAVVTLHSDGSVSVADNGRGTDTRLDGEGRPVRKPVMATKDVRFFESLSPPTLLDGEPRRGLSVVSALSSWLVHTNRRQQGSWTQRYEHGRPVTDLVGITDDGTTGTTVHFHPEAALVGGPRLDPTELRRLLETAGPPGGLTVEVRAETSQ